MPLTKNELMRFSGALEAKLRSVVLEMKDQLAKEMEKEIRRLCREEIEAAKNESNKTNN